MNNRKIKIIAGLVGSIVVISSATYWLEVWLPTRITISPIVKSSAKAVLTSQLLSKITGAYWENEMLEQAKIIDHLPLKERIDFYTLILLNCDLDTSRALLFSEMIEKDIPAFVNYLINFKESPRFKTLTLEQQKKVHGWIESLKLLGGK